MTNDEPDNPRHAPEAENSLSATTKAEQNASTKREGSAGEMKKRERIKEEPAMSKARRSAKSEGD